jgi:glycosyltransferase involved in cell wall biosynthesis
MKIGIDCRLAGKKHAGIGRYIEELVMRVTKESSIQWVLFFYEKDQLNIKETRNVKIVLAPIRHYSLAEQMMMPSIFSNEHVDLLHVPHYNVPILYTGKIVVTIHDLLWHFQPNSTSTTLSPLMHAIKYQAYKAVSKHAVFSAQRILVPAETVKQQITEIFPDLEQDKILVTYEGVGEAFVHANLQKKLSTKTLIYTGSLYPHKNVMLVVRALKELPEYKLVISSARTVFVDQFMRDVERMGLSERVLHLGRLSDQDLLEQYSQCAALVQPSFSEGFGLTGIEAMASGLPVLASHIPVFDEVYKNSYLSFDPKSVHSFVNAVQKLENSKRSELIENGKNVARMYSWDKMATQTLEMYKSLL